MILTLVFRLNIRARIDLIKRVLKIYAYVYKSPHIAFRHIFERKREKKKKERERAGKSDLRVTNSSTMHTGFFS